MVAMGEAVDTSSARKLRGAFFTPSTLCDHVVRWAVRSPADLVLEPSCGEAAFLLAATDRLRDLGRSEPVVEGIEVHGPSAAAASTLLHAAGARPRIRSTDFFAVPAEPRFDAVIGNPPYVRYQDFRGASRETALAAAAGAGVTLTNLASSWAAFTVHATRFLRPGGRLGLVLPAELLSVNYAADVRRHLLDRFRHIRLVMFKERIFPGVLEEVVLLLAEGQGPADRCEVVQFEDAASLRGTRGAATTWAPLDASAKWTPALLPPAGLDTYQAASTNEKMSTLRDGWGETTLGMVTGNNSFFALSPARVTQLGLNDGDVIPISPPGSRHLRSLSLSRRKWQHLSESSPTLLFRPAGEPSPAAEEYIRQGERAGVHLAYKCRVRNPWWRVPLVAPADLLLTCMNADAPQVAANEAAVHHLNSVHGIYLTADRRVLGRELLPLAALNSITLLGAELLGRTYGGGILKVEPKEADRLPMPSAALLREVRVPLLAAASEVESLLAAGRLPDAVDRIDEIVLLRGLRLTLPQRRALVHARQLLSARRTARGRPVGAR
jgi:adenine-specific DNA methylase